MTNAITDRHGNTQELLPLVHQVTVEDRRSLICVPDRDTAECERTRLQYAHGPDLLKIDIRIDKRSRSNPNGSRTYTVSYTIRRHEQRPIFGPQTR